MAEFYAVLLSAIVAVALPVSVLVIRETVKAGRIAIIGEIERVFSPKQQGTEGEEAVVPSIEFVKYKYGSGTSDNHWANTPRLHFIVAAFPLVVLTFLFGCISLSFIISSVINPPLKSLLLIPNIGQIQDLDPAKPVPDQGSAKSLSAVWVFTITYFAALLFIIRNLLRSVTNFDLSPLTFLNAALHVLAGITTALIVVHIWPEAFPTAVTVPALIVAAFVVGFVPDAGIRFILSQSRLQLMKRANKDAYDSVVSVDIDLIEGVDADVRRRLGEHNIVDVQNLASANPILLFVETPYGLYQLIDWVAQAQLCTAVGLKPYLQLRKLNIRTIFDLEKAVFDKENSTEELRGMIGAAIIPAIDLGGTTGGSESNAFKDRDKTIIALVGVVLDDLHVHRLRQIWKMIQERLGETNQRLVKPQLVAPSGPIAA